MLGVYSVECWITVKDVEGGVVVCGCHPGRYPEILRKITSTRFLGRYINTGAPSTKGCHSPDIYWCLRALSEHRG